MKIKTIKTIKTIWELKKYIESLPDDMRVENQWDPMYTEIAKWVFYLILIVITLVKALNN